jgi:triacylglycerol lipase
MPLPPIWRESRVPAELRALQRDPVIAGVGVPHGDGEPVLLIPGFMAGDQSMATMTLWLRRLGYRTSRAGIRLNTDCSTAALDRLEDRVERLAERHGQPLAVIGQSRGGLFARALAIRRPDLVSGIVTLGSPLRDQLAIHPLVRLNVGIVGALGTFGLRGAFKLDCLRGDCCRELRAHVLDPVPDEVGFISIYSKSDGIVQWRSCLDDDAEHVEVDSSHCGMGLHPDVYRVVGDALGEFSCADLMPARDPAAEPAAALASAA